MSSNPSRDPPPPRPPPLSARAHRFTAPSWKLGGPYCSFLGVNSLAGETLSGVLGDPKDYPNRWDGQERVSQEGPLERVLGTEWA